MEAAPMIDILFYAGLRRERAQRRRYVMAARLDPKFFFRARRGDLINPAWIDQLSR
jgi:DNA-binding LytR/AlgR family response regulator